MPAGIAHDSDDNDSAATGQKRGPPSALQLGPRKRPSVFRHLVLKLANRSFRLIALPKILLSTMDAILEG